MVYFENKHLVIILHSSSYWWEVTLNHYHLNIVSQLMLSWFILPFISEDLIPHPNSKPHLSIDLNLPLDRQEYVTFINNIVNLWNVNYFLLNHRWYHGSITRHEAENALRLHEEGSFLVRNSESSMNDYSLSVK